jgi:hypothetical protein
MTTFNVTAATDKTEYNTGDTVTVTIAGNATGDPTTATMTLTVNVTAADGSVGSAPLLSIPVTTPGAEQAVTIDSVTDSLGHTWTVSPDRLSASATA